MGTENKIILTREKHLDHMVKVVPFIVLCYGIQSFTIMKISPTDFSSISLTILGCLLAFMVAGFVFYDLKHKVVFEEDKLLVNFLFFKKEVSYEKIWSIELKDPGQTFSTITFKTADGRFSFFFVDDAEKIKAFVESKKITELKAA